MSDLMDKIVALCKRRGFVYPGSEIYGGLANSYDYGPLGIELKNNIKKVWWDRFVHRRDDIVGIDAAIIMNPKVWEASGHTGPGFADPLVECKRCHQRYRSTEIVTPGEYMPRKRGGAGMREEIENFMKTHLVCPNCGGKEFTEPRPFNILMKTYLGAVEGEKSQAYLRGETAQGMFVNFKNILDTTRKTLPFGVAQIGKAFRNEITPGNFIFRTREFEIMEIEYFILEKEWKKWFDYWFEEMKRWLQDDLGVAEKNLVFTEIPEAERAHYSKRTIDIEYKYPFGQKELYGLAYRTDFDLKNHEKFSGQNLKYRDPETGEEFWPHVIEPTWGVDRSVLVTLFEAYREEKDRVVLRLPSKLAPYKAAVFPLLANKPELVKLARKVYEELRKEFMVAWDDRGNIGKRYYSQDEIGTPWCVTVDFDSLKNKTVTVRDRDTTKQKRVKISDLPEWLKKRL